jgi:prophage tail gpP-like protein
MALYTAKRGDTPELISRNNYGSEKNASLIKASNPDVIFPTQGGESVTIPQESERTVSPLAVADVTVKVNGKAFTYWNNISIDRCMDKISTVSMACSFDPKYSAFVDAFIPFSYARVEVFTQGQKVFTGTIMNIIPSKTENSRTVSVDAYGLPGVLSDCCTANPREYLGNSLQQIVTNLIKPFGIKAVFADKPQGGAFDKVAIKPGDKVLEFLVDLAKKRRLLVTDSPDGELVFYRPEDTPSTATLEEGQSPLHTIVPKFNAQEYYSHITGVREASVSGSGGKVEMIFGAEVTPGAKHTVRNKFLKNIYRPYSYTVEDTDTGNLKYLVERKNRYMLANAISYDLELLTWLDYTGKLWVPYRTITITAPGAMIYNPNNFHIRSISLRKDGGSMTASMTLAVHGSFGGSLPEKLPWE